MSRYDFFVSSLEDSFDVHFQREDIPTGSSRACTLHTSAHLDRGHKETIPQHLGLCFSISSALGWNYIRNN
jgi:hypothetical protein